MSKKSSADNTKPRVVAVASFGGHLVQLMRIMEQFSNRYDITYISTSVGAKPADCDNEFITISDFYRKNPWIIFKNISKCRKVFKKYKPTAVISTGAAPGIAALLAARTMGIPSLWIDSIANVEKLSMSGRIASYIATTTLTQWPELQNKRVKFSGRVI